MSADLPWSDRVRLDQIGNGLKRTLEADAPTRARIAEALDLADLASLSAQIEIKPAGADWRLKGRVQADVVQTCGVTLEPLPATVDADFSVDLIAGDGSDDLRLDLDPDAPDGPDLIEDGGVDLAGYVVEHLALSLDPWPRKPGVEFEAPAGPEEPSPFAVLRDLKPRQ